MLIDEVCAKNSVITKNIAIFLACAPQGQSLLAIDYGTKKTGIAISDPDKKIAFPLKTIFESNKSQLSKKIKDLIEDKKIGGIVLGLPLTQANEAMQITKEVEELALMLVTEQNPVLLYDERFSSQAARNFFKVHGLTKALTRDTNDQVAASLMLSEILESQQS